jgi:hypothetical protein
VIVGAVGRLYVASAAIAACLALAASTPVLAQQAVQWRTQDGGNGHWYQLSATQLPWVNAQTASLARGGHLATMTSAAENSFANALCTPVLAGSPTPDSVWLGGFAPAGSCSISGGYSWVTGEPWGFTSWHPAEPNFDFECSLSYRPGYGALWNNFVAGSPAAYLVEWSADCDGNGIVDYGEILDGTLADTNANGVPDCCDAGVSCDPCPGDLNASNTIDAEDLAYVLFAWGTDGGKTPEADIDRSGTVDANDLSVVLGSWGTCP